MNHRIKLLRNTLDLTQQKFADRLGIKGNTISQYESGRNAPVDAVISLICREFNVNETWLRTGEGEMFRNTPESSQILNFIDQTLQSSQESFKFRFISALPQLSESDWETLEKLLSLVQ